MPLIVKYWWLLLSPGVNHTIAENDYDLSDKIVVLTPGMTTARASVQTVQDEIDEASEEYFVMFLETDNDWQIEMLMNII